MAPVNLRWGKAEKFDLILSDVRMADGTGLDIVDFAKLHDDQPPVILVTGFSDVSEENAIERGAVKVFDKPLIRKNIISQVYETLEIEPT